jgi:hypothetical protein
MEGAVARRASARVQIAISFMVERDIVADLILFPER